MNNCEQSNNNSLTNNSAIVTLSSINRNKFPRRVARPSHLKIPGQKWPASNEKA